MKHQSRLCVSRPRTFQDKSNHGDQVPDQGPLTLPMIGEVDVKKRDRSEASGGGKRWIKEWMEKLAPLN